MSPQKCGKELEDLVKVIMAHADLSGTYDRYAHECEVHNRKDSCEARDAVLESLSGSEETIKDTLKDFTACLGLPMVV